MPSIKCQTLGSNENLFSFPYLTKYLYYYLNLIVFNMMFLQCLSITSRFGKTSIKSNLATVLHILSCL